MSLFFSPDMEFLYNRPQILPERRTDVPILPKYSQFAGRHWETGSIANALAYQGIQVAQLKQPFSESLLMGISGGAAFGYFVFDYKGHDPHVALLSRNTFDPLQTLLERLAIPQDLFQTADPKKGERNLIEVLEGGRPAIVWADAFSLPYNTPAADQAMWGMLPILVYGYEGGKAYIADRSGKPLTAAVDELARARSRVKKDKFRVLALGAPDPKKVPGAVQKGIWQCIELFTEPPPKGTRDNFGFAAYQKWADMLTSTRNPQSWERLLAPGSRMYAALAGSEHQPGAFGWARTFPSNQVDDRMLYADFLDQASLILRKPKLKAAGAKFRASSAAWQLLGVALLPDEVPLFKETRQLLIRKRDHFVSKGEAAPEDRKKISARLAEIRASIDKKFPLSSEGAAALRAQVAEQVSKVSEIERQAIELMQAAML